MKALALIRVSTEDQSLDRQEAAARSWGERHGYAVEVVPEKVSGVAKVRPGLDRIMDACRKVKTRPAAVWVAELSRLGRSLVAVVQLLGELDSLGVRVVVENAGIDYGSPSGRMQAQIIAAFAEYERELLRERTRDGLAAARARGVQLGRRPDRWDDETLAEMRRRLDEGETPYSLWKSGSLTVWRPVVDVPTGEWTEKPVTPGRQAVYDKCAEVRG